MANQYLDFLVDSKLGGDRTRVAELFKDDSVLDELNDNAGSKDWFHFEPKSLDGDYLIKSNGDYSCYMQERGRVVSRVEKFRSLKEAAEHFFRTAGYF